MISDTLAISPPHNTLVHVCFLSTGVEQGKALGNSQLCNRRCRAVPESRGKLGKASNGTRTAMPCLINWQQTRPSLKDDSAQYTGRIRFVNLKKGDFQALRKNGNIAVSGLAIIRRKR
jgi:hypothetical protein